MNTIDSAQTLSPDLNHGLNHKPILSPQGMVVSADASGTTVVLANPRGFCAGVDRAIDIVELALAKFGAPIYVRHEIVHNTFVVNDLKQKGAIFIEDLHHVPKGATLVYSAHGVPRVVRKQAESMGLSIFDATCPLVTKVHIEVMKLRRDGYDIVMIGHAGHPEVEGTMGQVEHDDGIDAQMYLVETVADALQLTVPQADKLAYVSQTTLSVDDTAAIVAALQQRFPLIKAPKKGDICYATQNRQDAVKVLSTQVDVVIVVGSPSSSNSNRLVEVARNKHIPAYLVDNAEGLQASWLAGVQRVGVSAGASAPDVLVQAVIERLKQLGAISVRELSGVQEDVHFPLPKGLK
jgi:4-hydroxy-3-methylbut-2-en-1-yl diphosphate reductase